MEHAIKTLFLDEITQTFRRFGPLVVDWPHKAESKSYFPPKGTSHNFSSATEFFHKLQVEQKVLMLKIF